MQSAVRLPTPPPLESTHDTNLSRKRPRSSSSTSPNRRASPYQLHLRGSRVLREVDFNRNVEHGPHFNQDPRPHEKNSTASKPLSQVEKDASARAEYESLLNKSRSGPTYMPPAKLRALQAAITDKQSPAYQRLYWDNLKKSINGLVNKANVSNLRFVSLEMFQENMVRGRGLFCRSISKSAAASLPFIPIYAALVAIINTKLPQVGELLLRRLILQFKKAYKRNDKAVCIWTTVFIAHLINFQVGHELLGAQILLLLLNRPTDDSVEIAVGLTRALGQHLEEMNQQIATAIFDQFRSILQNNDISTRVQYSVEVLMQVRKDKYKDDKAVPEELDLVPEEDMITHRIGLDEDPMETMDSLNVFKLDDHFEEHEAAYRKLKSEILGEADSDGEELESDSASNSEEEDEEAKQDIQDRTNTDLVNLRRMIYLTIVSSGTYEECVHKLMKVNLPPGQEKELVSMIIECCSQSRTYEKFYGLIGERFAKLNRLWMDLFTSAFPETYETIHRRETNQLRNVARFFGHMISSGAIGFEVLSVIHLNEEETTSSSRIFIKILWQSLAEDLGMKDLQTRLQDEALRPYFEGLFPKDNPRNTRFSINYFTSIGMGGLTEELREYLKNAPKPAAVMPPPEPVSDSESSVSSYSSYSSYSGSSKSYSRSRSPSHSRPTRRRQFSPSRSRTPPRRDSARGRERTPPRRGNRGARSFTPSGDSRSPSPRRSRKRRSPSYSSPSRTPPPRSNRRRGSYSRSR